jgi:hypothetical protein
MCLIQIFFIQLGSEKNKNGIVHSEKGATMAMQFNAWMTDKSFSKDNEFQH